MLMILRRIVQELNSAHHLDDTLQILVKRVREAISAKACSVFLIDEKKQEYVLLATDGLNPEAVGKVRLKLDEGLVGLVGQREEPINIEDAPSHPRFFHSPSLHEESFKAFLGVPIIHNRHRLGVLVVQQSEKYSFDETEEAFLVTMSVQLGAIIAYAKATGTVSYLLHPAPDFNLHENIVFSGVAGSSGLSIGTAVGVYPLADLGAVPIQKTDKPQHEIKTFIKALHATRKDIRKLRKELYHLSKEERALFDAYLHILDSTSLENEVVEEIIHYRIKAQGALRKVIEHHMQQFSAMDDLYLRERAADLRDLGGRILMHLQKEEYISPSFPKQTILVGDEITPSALAEVPRENLAGIISKRGSCHSHVAILARALGIPSIMGVENLPVPQLEGEELFLDGFEGKIYIRPTQTQRDNFVALIKVQNEFIKSLEEIRHSPAETLDGHSMILWANAGLEFDSCALLKDVEGIGLYRTEIPFMTRESFPTEDDQYAIYSELLKKFFPKPVSIRTLDAGGDKILPYFPIEEENPFLGWRGIRITLDHPDLFLIQIRAMLRANRNLNNLRIMLPMISNVQEVDEAMYLIHQAFRELKEEDAKISMPPVGVMIEVPSAVYQTEALIQRADFLSVGSNDLTQYILAVDRNNARVANLYDSLNPAVLHALNYVAKTAHKANKFISICGEMTSDPLAIPLLVAMGFDALSMNPIAILRSKWIIRGITLKKCRRLLKSVLRMNHAQEIRSYLQHALKDFELGKLM
jgi:phosphotransferase system enzyme I (PtsP)